MPIIIIPGIHSPELTNCFVEAVQNSIQQEYLILPTDKYLPYDALSIYQWLEQARSPSQPMSFITFSAGVVGGIGAALAWQLRGGQVQSFIAFDGWGMPLVGSFPIYRVSHDRFTDWSSGILGGGTGSFYADPTVSHLDLWRSPNICLGWRYLAYGLKTRCSLIDYLQNILSKNIVGMVD